MLQDPMVLSRILRLPILIIFKIEPKDKNVHKVESSSLVRSIDLIINRAFFFFKKNSAMF